MSDKFQDKYRISSARAAWWDYAANGAYFVTICTANREHYFGEIVKTPPQPLSPPSTAQQMQLSEIGNIVQQYWMEIPNHFAFVKLDAFVVMPNQISGHHRIT